MQRIKMGDFAREVNFDFFSDVLELFSALKWNLIISKLIMAFIFFFINKKG